MTPLLLVTANNPPTSYLRVLMKQRRYWMLICDCQNMAEQVNEYYDRCFVREAYKWWPSQSYSQSSVSGNKRWRQLSLYPVIPSLLFFLSSLYCSNPPKNISPSVSRGWLGLCPALGRPPVLEASGLQEPGARRGGGPGAMGAHASHQPATAAGGWNHPGRWVSSHDEDVVDRG